MGSRTTISFKRPLTTNDNDDFQFTETNCGYFMFPKGGDFDHTTLSFTKHDLTPIVSANKICFPCTSGKFLTRLMVCCFFMVFNATFNNISVLSWWSVLLVEETKDLQKTTDLSQVTDKLIT